MNAYEIFKTVKPEIVQQMLGWLREEERDLYKNAVATLAQDRKLRPVFVQKKSLKDQFAWVHKTLMFKTSNMMGEHLLQLWFMKGQQEILITFCDNLEIKHDGTGSIEAELPETLDADKLKSAVDALLENNSPQLVTTYLHVFNLQKVDGWESLTTILDSDDRLTLA